MSPAGNSTASGVAAEEKSPTKIENPKDFNSDDLRTNGNGEAHNYETPMTFRRFMGFLAMAFLWNGSQIPVYLFGAVPPYVYRDIGGTDRWIWFVLAYLLALGGVCPFVGSLSDLIGRRWVSIFGASLVCMGMVVCSTAKTMNTFICGMSLAGAGAGVNELTALTATSEMAPTRKRGKFVAVLIFTILPFAPSVLWGQPIAFNVGWRYIALLCGLWGALGLFLTIGFYHPPPRANSKDLGKNDIFWRVDFLGGLLSIGGMTVFLAGLQWGGYQYPWESTHVLGSLIVGFVTLVIFFLWEIYGAKYPILPKKLKQEPRILALTLVITFISGMNFFSVLMFWPTQAFNVYGHDPIQIGIRGIPIAFSIMVGACVVLWLLSVFRGRNRELLAISSGLMTIGCGSMAYADVDNLNKLWGFLIIAGLGIGGIAVPASIITTILCPDDLIATVAALTLSTRVIGGGVGYTIYFNVFSHKFKEHATKYIGGAMALKLGITNPTLIKAAIMHTSESLLEELRHIPGIEHNETAYDIVVRAGQVAFAESYKWVYYVSIAFGAICTFAACFLPDISGYMDDHVAVVIH